jgi:hypothetical protein
MVIHPLEFVGAFLAACLVLSAAKFKETGRYRLRSMLILMTLAAIALGAIAYSLRK